MQSNITIDAVSDMCKKMRAKSEQRRERIRRDLEKYGGVILRSEEMKRAFTQTHHQCSTVGDHTMRVASSGVKMCYVLRRLHIKVDVHSVVVGSLCHDLGILGRHEKYASDIECCRQHPKDSVEVVRKLVPEMAERTADIIERHMWPIGCLKMPNSIEGFVVTAADKYSSVKDLVKGSERRRAAV